MPSRDAADNRWIENLLAGRAEGSVAIVAAHPDDETIGAGGSLPRFGEATLLHLTDGAPRDGRDAAAAGFETREAYAAARRREMIAAVALAGIPIERCIEVGQVDQEASLHLDRLACRLADWIGETRPDFILTHPYEGGHPDHDAAAFAVHAARRLLAREGWPAPNVAEFTSYHLRDGVFAAGVFLPAEGFEESAVPLSEAERELKARMFACFATQRQVLSAFRIETERFRPAPAYDFTRPPHPGPLHYESFDWGMTGARWRGLAGEALRTLGLEGPL